MKSSKKFKIFKIFRTYLSISFSSTQISITSNICLDIGFFSLQTPTINLVAKFLLDLDVLEKYFFLVYKPTLYLASCINLFTFY